MRMNDRLQQLALFVRTVETGSFSRAAREFGLTQPSASRAVAALEERLGVKLIARTTNLDELESKTFTGHPNKHVRTKAKNKLARLT